MKKRDIEKNNGKNVKLKVATRKKNFLWTISIYSTQMWMMMMMITISDKLSMKCHHFNNNDIDDDDDDDDEMNKFFFSIQINK